MLLPRHRNSLAGHTLRELAGAHNTIPRNSTRNSPLSAATRNVHSSVGRDTWSIPPANEPSGGNSGQGINLEDEREESIRQGIISTEGDISSMRSSTPSDIREQVKPLMTAFLRGTSWLL
ncbi:hypothetical protein BJX70DRAFT_355758 [Aspergillus crustosus]